MDATDQERPVYTARAPIYCIFWLDICHEINWVKKEHQTANNKRPIIRTLFGRRPLGTQSDDCRSMLVKWSDDCRNDLFVKCSV